MKIKAKNSTIEAKKESVKNNVTVTKGTKENQSVLRAGTPNDHSRKHSLDSNYVGMNIGTTINMDNYESLRVDVWGTEEVKENETKQQAFNRLKGVLDSVLEETVTSYSEE